MISGFVDPAAATGNWDVWFKFNYIINTAVNIGHLKFLEAHTQKNEGTPRQAMDPLGSQQPKTPGPHSPCCSLFVPVFKSHGCAGKIQRSRGQCRANGGEFFFWGGGSWYPGLGRRMLD